MENEVKRCPACGKKIPDGSKATYCSKKCVMAVFYQRHNPRKVLADECLCYYNSEVLCSNRECENCGWNPIVEQQRKEALYEEYEVDIEEVEDDG